MYFDSYQECLDAAIKQSKGQLVDCKVYVRYDTFNHKGFYISFVNTANAKEYVYNGEVKQVETEGN